MFVSDLTPASERCLDRFDFLQHICSAPFDSPVVIGCVAMLKHVHKGVRDRVKMFENVKIMARRRSGLEVCVQVIALCRSYLDHRRVVEHASDGEAFRGTLPVLRRLHAEKMEEGVVRCGYRPPEAGLFGTFRLSIGEMARLFEEILRKRHLLPFPKRVAEHGLL